MNRSSFKIFYVLFYPYCLNIKSCKNGHCSDICKDEFNGKEVMLFVCLPSVPHAAQVRHTCTRSETASNHTKMSGFYKHVNNVIVGKHISMSFCVCSCSDFLSFHFSTSDFSSRTDTLTVAVIHCNSFTFIYH